MTKKKKYDYQDYSDLPTLKDVKRWYHKIEEIKRKMKKHEKTTNNVSRHYPLDEICPLCGRREEEGVVGTNCDPIHTVYGIKGGAIIEDAEGNIQRDTSFRCDAFYEIIDDGGEGM